MRDPLRLMQTVVRLGPGNVALYALHRLRLTSGWYRRRTPEHAWKPLEASIVASARSPFPPPHLARVRESAGASRKEVLQAAERIVAGSLLYFSHLEQPRPPDWQSFPEGPVVARAGHWSQAHVPAEEDVKWIWEPSRFGWIYELGRAWALSGDERFLAHGLALIADWQAFNPPNSGINWNCAQECSIRLFAVVWALGVFRDSPLMTEGIRGGLWALVAALAERVVVSTSYARAQRNNHLLAEATALYVAGCALPDHPEARRWRNQGRALFLEAIPEQFADDGSYILHSMNYAREALRDASVFLLAARHSADDLPSEIGDRLRAAVRFLYELQDPRSGQLPNYGPNDGSNYLSLSSAAYEDYRPVIQTLSVLLDGTRRYEPGLHDEELGWFFPEGGSWPLRAEPRQTEFRAPAGGYYALRGDASWAMLRCHSFHQRPTHSDMLHFDFWHNGMNLLIDSGTFQYADQRGWSRYFESTAAHNTVVVDDHDPMTKVGRFLWADWTRSRLLRFATRDDGVLEWSGEHYGYQSKGVVHRRTVLLAGNDWLIVDDLLTVNPSIEHTAALRWHLHPAGGWEPREGGAWSPTTSIGIFVTGGEVSFREGGSIRPETLMSRRYAQLEPAPLLECRAAARGSIRLVTAIGKAPTRREQADLVWAGGRVPVNAGE